MKNNYMIRNAIFETNSSSSHSFTMGPEGRLSDIIYADNDNCIQIDTSEWENYLKTNLASAKLSYLCSFLYTLFEEGDELFIKIKDTIRKTVIDFTGAADLNIINDGEGIDHQSTDIIDYRDLMNPTFIKEFVFNPDTWIYPIWDSDDVDEDFYEGEKHLLYKIFVTLKTSEETPIKIEIPIYFEDRDEADSKIYNALSSYEYDCNLKVFKEANYKDQDAYFYKGKFTWKNSNGDSKEVTPSIIFE